MRETNFRVWHPKNKQMYFIDSLYFHGDGVDLVKCFPYGATSYEEFGITELFYAEDVVLMEYTGLKDKSGKKIYEGDILSDGSKYLVEVVYHQGAARFGISVDKKQEPSVMYAGSMLTCKSIGNIYQNGELLDVK